MGKERFIRKWLKKAVLLLVVFVMTAGTVCQVNAAGTTFPDVADPGAYYYDAVYWASDNGITTGRGGYFKPNQTCTRGEAVTFLYRIAGQPSISGSSSFVDVQDSNKFYYNPVIWAVQNEITTGYGNDANGRPTFQPDALCDRAMIVTLLMRYAEKIAKNYIEPKGSDSPFPDVSANIWYAKSVRWAAENGITTGKGDGKFYPRENCTRGQIVTFLYRYVNMKIPGEDIELPPIPV